MGGDLFSSVRGAPAIGVTGGYAYYVLADQIETEVEAGVYKKMY